MRFDEVRIAAPAGDLGALADFYERMLPRAAGAEGQPAFTLGETRFVLVPGPGAPFFHLAFLVPGDRFAAALDWASGAVSLLPGPHQGHTVVDFPAWDAQALYFHDPAGNIVELIAHRGIAVNGASGAFDPRELVGMSEVGVVCDPPRLASELEDAVGLRLWDGGLEGERSLGFVGRQARTLILCRAGRPWLPTGRPAEAHPIDIIVGGAGAGQARLPGGGRIVGS